MLRLNGVTLSESQRAQLNSNTTNVKVKPSSEASGQFEPIIFKYNQC